MRSGSNQLSCSAIQAPSTKQQESTQAIFLQWYVTARMPLHFCLTLLLIQNIYVGALHKGAECSTKVLLAPACFKWQINSVQDWLPNQSKTQKYSKEYWRFPLIPKGKDLQNFPSYSQTPCIWFCILFLSLNETPPPHSPPASRSIIHS